MRVELRGKLKDEGNYCVEVREKQFAEVNLLVQPNRTLIIVAIENGTHHKGQSLAQCLYNN